MAAKREAHRRRAELLRVKEVLMRGWDPIGVAKNPLAANEYDSYAAKIHLMLINDRADRHKLAQYLSNVTQLSMGISQVDTAAIQRTVAALIDLREELDS